MQKEEKAIFAGGCFWCMEPPFQKLEGVKRVSSGYTGGIGKDPIYEDYAEKGHIEAIEIVYDPMLISYEKLLEVFWRQINPTDGGGQFCDRGLQYRSAVFYAGENQKQAALKSKKDLASSGRFKSQIATELIAASKFYPAEEYHQEYHKKNPIRYKFYRFSCGRDKTLNDIWGESS